MQQRLEEYLAQVEHELRGVPAPQRDEELREMRQHLIDNVTVNQEILGYDEEQAVATVLEEFGAPKKLAAEILTAWRRGDEKTNWIRIGMAAFYSTVFLYPAFLFAGAVANGAIGSQYRLHDQGGVHENIHLWVVLNWAIVVAIAGIYCIPRTYDRRWFRASILYIGWALLSARPDQHTTVGLPLFLAYIVTTSLWAGLWAMLAIRWQKERQRSRLAE